MDFAPTEKVALLCDQVEKFFADEILPHHPTWLSSTHDEVQGTPAFMQELRAKAYEMGLWNLGLPNLRDDEPGTRLTNLEFAPLAEIMGRLPWAPQVFNCHAPEVPNMEILQLFASPEQREAYLKPLLEGQIRSSFAMTEPAVASSDATNIATRIERDGDNYVINGRKWFASNAGNPETRFLIVVGITNPEAKRGRQHSLVIVPKDTPGLTVVRSLPVLHHVDRATPHSEVLFENVTVPVSARLGKEGAGFVIGQARLGPARVHHCMRAIGRAEVLLRLMIERINDREAFGARLRSYSNITDAVAESRIELEQSRLLVQRTAWLLDQEGNKAARKEVSLIKIAVARMFHNIADRGIQMFGAMGLTDDAPFASALAQARAFRIYDGPDEVHLRTIYRLEEREALSDNQRLSPHFLRGPGATG